MGVVVTLGEQIKNQSIKFIVTTPKEYSGFWEQKYLI